MDAEISGEGEWCSNSKSINFRRRVKNVDWCDIFQERGKKALLSMRLKMKLLSLANRTMQRKNGKPKV